MQGVSKIAILIAYTKNKSKVWNGIFGCTHLFRRKTILKTNKCYFVQKLIDIFVIGTCIG